ncbi:hypothetical protein BpHYR1_016394 [Brachionus plicatilis]|uniref:Uncharacterized protein n=1 Tax=Brachionus plicatilis TaxID=10195 RepID=A0A3M7SX52_BRAPC|nr:hypothetical protein BpHYR1_016394 [Brachionus plicatilis]
MLNKKSKFFMSTDLIRHFWTILDFFIKKLLSTQSIGYFSISSLNAFKTSSLIKPVLSSSNRLLSSWIKNFSAVIRLSLENLNIRTKLKECFINAMKCTAVDEHAFWSNVDGSDANKLFSLPRGLLRVMLHLGQMRGSQRFGINFCRNFFEKNLLNCGNLIQLMKYNKKKKLVIGDVDKSCNYRRKYSLGNGFPQLNESFVSLIAFRFDCVDFHSGKETLGVDQGSGLGNSKEP